MTTETRTLHKLTRIDGVGPGVISTTVRGAKYTFNRYQTDRAAADFPAHDVMLTAREAADFKAYGIKATPITDDERLKSMTKSQLVKEAFARGFEIDKSAKKAEILKSVLEQHAAAADDGDGDDDGDEGGEAGDDASDGDE